MYANQRDKINARRGKIRQKEIVTYCYGGKIG
jgi:hypothetical protein